MITQVNGLRSGMLQDGTLIGEGLATAVDRLSKSDAKSKVVILFTDGKEEAPETRLIDPLTALEIAKSQGVKVYTIGMSAENAIPVEENIKGKTTPATNSFLDEELLRRIAGETGGEYFRARDKLRLAKYLPANRQNGKIKNRNSISSALPGRIYSLVVNSSRFIIYRINIAIYDP